MKKAEKMKKNCKKITQKNERKIKENFFFLKKAVFFYAEFSSFSSIFPKNFLDLSKIVALRFIEAYMVSQ